ncbi:MAG: iron-containing alcohol dehydrogenase [Candidatus Hydrogenedentota bacterium]
MFNSNFNIETAKEIYFGNGKIELIPVLLKKNQKKKALIVTGKNFVVNTDWFKSILEKLKENKIEYIIYSQRKGLEPELEDIDKGVTIAKEEKVDSVVAVGGGGSIDTGKAVSCLVINGGKIVDYLEGVGINKQIDKPSLYTIAVPTTAGTGSEVTKNAVIKSNDYRFKKSIRHKYLIPDAVICDPQLLITLSERTTLISGMDAFVQLIEPYTSKNTNPFVESLCEYAIPIIARAIPEVKDKPGDIEIRAKMLFCSLVSGIALANAGLGAAHGVASGIGALMDIEHGLICAVMMPYVVSMNKEVCSKKYKRIEELIGIETKKQEDSLAFYLMNLLKRLGFPYRLRDLNINENMLEEIAFKSLGSSMSQNPLICDKDRILGLLKEAY